MGPIELFFLGIGTMIVLVAIVRGYDRELGNCIIAQVAVFIISFFEGRLEGVLNTIGNDIFGVSEPSLNLFKFLFMTIAFASIIMASYWGVTLDFPGKPMAPPQGTLIAIGMGLLNAYLIGGTIWYFLDKYQYPVAALGALSTAAHCNCAEYHSVSATPAVWSGK